MRKYFLATLIAAGLLSSGPAVPQGIQIDTDVTDPYTKLPADKWIQVAIHMIDASPLVGKDAVYMVNATGEDISSVMCKSYALVGQSTYIGSSNKSTNAPTSLRKWSVTLVPTEGFDKYCTNGVDASGTVAQYHGRLNAGSFSASTFIIFKNAS